MTNRQAIAVLKMEMTKTRTDFYKDRREAYEIAINALYEKEADNENQRHSMFRRQTMLCTEEQEVHDTPGDTVQKRQVSVLQRANRGQLGEEEEMDAIDMTDRYWKLKAAILEKPYCWQKDCMYSLMSRCTLLNETEREKCSFWRER